MYLVHLCLLSGHGVEPTKGELTIEQRSITKKKEAYKRVKE